ncbi:hypothetical protein D3C71_259790 [compost metagenome]
MALDLMPRPFERPQGMGAIGVHVGGSEGAAIAVEHCIKVHELSGLKFEAARQRVDQEMVAGRGLIKSVALIDEQKICRSHVKI